MKSDVIAVDLVAVFLAGGAYRLVVGINQDAILTKEVER